MKTNPSKIMLLITRAYVALLLLLACLTLTSCSGADGGVSPIVGQWVTSRVQLQIEPDGSLTSVTNGYRSYGTYTYVNNSRKKVIATGVSQTEAPLELLLLSRNTLQVKLPRDIRGRTSEILYDTVVLSRAEDDVYKQQR